MPDDRRTLRLNTVANIAKAIDGIRWVSSRLDEGWQIILTRKRRDAQNNPMWMWLTQISQELEWHGKYWTPEQWKDCLMHAYKGGEFMPGVDGGFVPIGRSTSALGVKDFALFLDSVDAFAAQHGVTLPQPDEQAQRSAA